MGLYNNEDYKKDFLKLKDNICPICDGSIMPKHSHNPEQASFDYVCDSCNPYVIISLSDSVLTGDNFNKILNNDMVKKYLSEKIKNQTNGQVSINNRDFSN